MVVNHLLILQQLSFVARTTGRVIFKDDGRTHYDVDLATHHKLAVVTIVCIPSYSYFFNTEENAKSQFVQ